MRCYCCSQISFIECCEPIITGAREADSPEQLMRSRFSAYCISDYQYIIATYSKAQRQTLSEQDIQSSAVGIKWFALNVNAANSALNTVEFSAYYFEGNNTGILHETSQFVFEDSKWRYHDGVIHTDSGSIKIGRNDSCPCQSGKKFKHCCAR